MAAPVNIIANYSDGTKESFHQTRDLQAITASAKAGDAATVKISSKKKVESISLDGGIFMDADTTNNTWKEKAF
jgi:hypothetical protein